MTENNKMAQNGADQVLDILGRFQGAWTKDTAIAIAEALDAKDTEIERLRADLSHPAFYWRQQYKEVEVEVERLRALVQCLLDNNPDDMAADGITVLDVWRKEARAALEGKL